MRASLATILLGCLALALATNSTGNDTSLSSSQRVEVRQVLPFQPSPSDQQESDEAKAVGSKLQVSGSPTSSSGELAAERSTKVERINIENAKDSGNNTIDTAGTGHYGHFSEAFLPAPILYQEEPHHKQLKPSVVHRDPHAHFNTYDAIRTQDYDPQHQIYPTTIHKDEELEEIGLHGHGNAYGYGPGHGYYDTSKAYDYDVHVIPECAHKNRYYYNLTFCLDDGDYPSETILSAIRQSGHYAEKLFSDVTYQSADNLVDGLTRAEEEGYTYQHYFGGSHHQHLHLDKYKPPYQGYSYSPEYYKKGGYICPSDIYYARPRRAMNTYGKWKVIVNLDYVPKELNYIEQGHGYGYPKHQAYTQTLRLEKCIYPNAPCSYIDTRVHSSCLQKHNFVRLVAWTYEQGIHVDSFKMPIACSCHIKQPVHFYQLNQPVIHVQEQPQVAVPVIPQYILQ